jgi:hypothetical protein
VKSWKSVGQARTFSFVFSFLTFSIFFLFVTEFELVLEIIVAMVGIVIVAEAGAGDEGLEEQ